ncbi:helix-turn-helix domain-containing protein [Cyanobium sp. FGCU-52]|nr:helix-turn-helix domain-containing protein [Cyanobium sp. FGCU52]
MPESPASASSDTLPELLALGQKLREARSRRGLSQEELAERLRLGTDQLDALEQGDRRRLPEPVFVIAQAKRVAGSLGITIDEQISALRRSGLMEPVRRPTPLLVAPEPLGPEPGPPRLAPPASAMPGWLPAAAAAVVALGLATALLLPKPRQQPSGTAAVSTPTDVVPAAPPAPPTRPATAASLELRPRDISWLAVRELNGRTLFEGTLSEPRSFPLGRGLEVRAGRPDQVSVSAPGLAARPLAASDDYGWKRFSPPMSPPPAAPAPPPAPRP